MSDPNSIDTACDVPELDVPEILQSQFDALWLQVHGDVIAAVELYEADESIGKTEACYRIAEFDRRKWADRKLEKNLRKQLAAVESDDNIQVFPYIPEIDPDTLHLDIAKVTVVQQQQRGHRLGYTMDLFRTTTAHSTDVATGAFLPDTVTYSIGFKHFVEPLTPASNLGRNIGRATLAVLA
jgi:hypothetical protein